jgi:type IV pilus assembly protein PilE
MKPVRASGFTLIELMIALVVVAIITAVALPSYTDYVTRGKVPDATAGLATKQVEMEQYFQDNRTYVSAPACNSDTTRSKYFDFSCTGVAAGTYTLRAVGKDSMTGFTYTVNQANAKATTAVPSGWATATDCWVTKKGGVC